MHKAYWQFQNLLSLFTRVAYKFFPIRAVLQQDLIALKKKWSKREKKILDLVVARALKKEGC